MRAIIFFCLLSRVLFADLAERRLKEMSIGQKVGQLFVIPVTPLEEKYIKEVESLISSHHIGNLIVKRSDPKTQIKVLNRLQKQAKDPLFILADAEWGLGMRMIDTISFPKNDQLGRLKDLSLIDEIGTMIGHQCRQVGVHMNLAPVVDVNHKGGHQIIGSRSFGSDPKRVAHLATRISRAMQRGGVLTCAKHFPGHGGAAADSHEELPKIDLSKEELMECDLIPFIELIDDVDAVMTGHLNVPALSDEPASLSYEIVTGLLKNRLGYKGLVISDALNMHALDHYEPGDEAIKCLRAGHDLLLYGDHIGPRIDDILLRQVPIAFKRILEEVRGGLDIDEKVLKILRKKEEMGLFDQRLTDEDFDLRLSESQKINKRIGA